MVPQSGHLLPARAAGAWPAATVVTEISGENLRDLRDRLGVHAPFDIIIDVAGRGLAKRMEWLTPLVSERGRYVGGGKQAIEVAGSRRDLLLPLRDSAQEAVLAAQPWRGQVLLTLPAQTLSRRGTLTMTRPMPGISHPATTSIPSLSLREHRDVTCLPYQVAHDDTFVLSASFREFERRRLVHSDLDKAPHGYLRRPDAAPEPLPGRWFYFDTNVPEHFGHAVTEQLSLVWGWRSARDRHPGLQALVFAPPSGEVPTWTWDLWAAAGLSRADVRVLHAPVRVERLLTCSPMLRIGQYAHPAIREVWDDVGEHLAATPSTRERWPERIFHTRGGDRRTCRNQAEVEDLFCSLGFEVVSPADHSLAEQAQLARHARIIAGFAGSGMYQIAFTGRPKQVVAIAAEAYPAHNEHHMASVLGHRLDLVVCRADVPRADPGKFSPASYASSYAFDMQRDAAAVRELVGQARR